MNTNKPIIQQDPSIRQDPDAWQAGFDAAAAGLPCYPTPPGVQDHLAYCSGWIEGAAIVKLARKITSLPPVKRQLIDRLLWS